MAGSSGLHHELAALQAELGRQSRSGVRPHPTPAERDGDGKAADAEDTPRTARWDETLKELGESLSASAERAEDLLAEHPLACVLAAFVLGVAVGRLAGRS